MTQSNDERHALKAMQDGCPVCRYEHRRAVECAAAGGMPTDQAVRKYGLEAELGALAGELFRQHRLAGHAPTREQLAAGPTPDYRAAEGHALLRQGQAMGAGAPPLIDVDDPDVQL